MHHLLDSWISSEAQCNETQKRGCDQLSSLNWLQTNGESTKWRSKIQFLSSIFFRRLSSDAQWFVHDARSIWTRQSNWNELQLIQLTTNCCKNLQVLQSEKSLKDSVLGSKTRKSQLNQFWRRPVLMVTVKLKESLILVDWSTRKIPFQCDTNFAKELREIWSLSLLQEQSENRILLSRSWEKLHRKWSTNNNKLWQTESLPSPYVQQLQKLRLIYLRLQMMVKCLHSPSSQPAYHLKSQLFAKSLPRYPRILDLWSLQMKHSRISNRQKCWT